jgi:hypothetical protein
MNVKIETDERLENEFARIDTENQKQILQQRFKTIIT